MVFIVKYIIPTKESMRMYGGLWRNHGTIKDLSSYHRAENRSLYCVLDVSCPSLGLCSSSLKSNILITINIVKSLISCGADTCSLDISNHWCLVLGSGTTWLNVMFLLFDTPQLFEDSYYIGVAKRKSLVPFPFKCVLHNKTVLHRPGLTS